MGENGEERERERIEIEKGIRAERRHRRENWE